MTAAGALTYYPQYCFHRSPTIDRWCPLRAVDIASLACQPGFQDSHVFFYLNYPIKWVRIMGVVVAVDEYYGRRVYTIDDSTGQCIECTLRVRTVAGDKKNQRDSDKGKGVELQYSDTKAGAETKAAGEGDIDVGMVLDVRGSLNLFRGQKQINIDKTTLVLSTDQEVRFWDKIRNFRRDVLGQPWVLTDEDVQESRWLQSIDAAELAREKGLKTGGRAGGAGATRASGGRIGHASRTGLESVKTAKEQRAARLEILRARASKGGDYGALGL